MKKISNIQSIDLPLHINDDNSFMTFKELHLVDPILRSLEEIGYTSPTPIQEQAIPILLRGKDLLGCAQTGTGKTAAFAIPIIQNLFLDKQNDRGPRKISTLVVTPTRELAIQIDESFSTYGKYTNLKNTVIYGGVKQGKQVAALNRGVDILVATPGRLLDLINQGYISLSDVKYSVLDEADQMLDMGFIHDIKKIIAKLPSQRQSLFFSATMPRNIVTLSEQMLGDPMKITIKPEQATAEKVGQSVYFVSKKDKIKLLSHLITSQNAHSTLVFSRTKHGANKIVKLLGRDNITAEAIHGNKSQGARQKALGNFKSGATKVLVATDIAARGIDVSNLSHVINYDLPNVPETYVHRIGRTGRADASGVALSFCDIEELSYLKDIQKLINQQIPVVSDHPFPDDGKRAPAPPSNQRGGNGRNNQRGGRQGQRNNNQRSSNNRSGNNSNRNNRSDNRQGSSDRNTDRPDREQKPTQERSNNERSNQERPSSDRPNQERSNNNRRKNFKPNNNKSSRGKKAYSLKTDFPLLD